MNYIRKNEWVRKTKGTIKVYETLINALETLCESEQVRAFNEKRITKTQIEKLQPLMPEHCRIELRADGMFNDTIDIYLYADMDGLQDPKTRMYDHFRISEKIYQFRRDTNMPVYLGTGRIFNYFNFVKCAESRIDALKKYVAEYQDCIKNINKYQRMYAKMEKVIEETSKAMPSPFKVFVNFSNPILND